MDNIRTIVDKKPDIKRKDSLHQLKRMESSRHIISSVDRTLQLQRAIGNQAMQSLFESGVIQAKLNIGAPDDIYEQEADRMADQVMRMPDPTIQRQKEKRDEEEVEKIQTKPIAEQITPLIQRQVELEEEDEEEHIQAKPNTEQITPVVQKQAEEEEEKKDEEEPIQPKMNADQSPKASSQFEQSLQNIRSGGQPLEPITRTYFEPRFGVNFGKVRVHTNNEASATARSINAQAYTIGHDIVFGAGNYVPGSDEGKRLIAHELTHTIQQDVSLSRVVQKQAQDYSDLDVDRFFETSGGEINRIILKQKKDEKVLEEIKTENTEFYQFQATLEAGQEYQLEISFTDMPTAVHRFISDKSGNLQLAIRPGSVMKRRDEIKKRSDPLLYIKDRYNFHDAELNSVKGNLDIKYKEHEISIAKINTGLAKAIDNFNKTLAEVNAAVALENAVIGAILAVVGIGVLGIISNKLQEIKEIEKTVNMIEDFAQAAADKVTGFVKIADAPPSPPEKNAVVDLNERRINITELSIVQEKQIQHVRDIMKIPFEQAVEYEAKKVGEEDMQEIINIYTGIEFYVEKIINSVTESDFYKVPPKVIATKVYENEFEKCFWADYGKDWIIATELVIYYPNPPRTSITWKGDIMAGIGDPMLVHLNELLKDEGITFERWGEPGTENMKYYKWAKSYKRKTIN